MNYLNSTQLPDQGSALYRAWETLLNNAGYNWYREENQLQADDLLIRKSACEYLDQGLTRLRDLELAFRRKHPGVRSRTQPPVDPVCQRESSGLAQLIERIDSLETRVRKCVMPPKGVSWKRGQDQPRILGRLNYIDTVLVGTCNHLLESIKTQTEEPAWDSTSIATIATAMNPIEKSLEERAAILNPG